MEGRTKDNFGLAQDDTFGNMEDSVYVEIGDTKDFVEMAELNSTFTIDDDYVDAGTAMYANIGSSSLTTRTVKKMSSPTSAKTSMSITPSKNSPIKEAEMNSPLSDFVDGGTATYASIENSEPTTPTVKVSPPITIPKLSLTQVGSKSFPPIIMRKTNSKNKSLPLYQPASPSMTAARREVSNAERQSLYSYAAPDFPNIGKSATLSVPTADSKVDSNCMKSNTTPKGKEQQAGQCENDFSLKISLKTGNSAKETKEFSVHKDGKEKVKKGGKKKIKKEDEQREKTEKNEPTEVAVFEDRGYVEPFHIVNGSLKEETGISPSSSQRQLVGTSNNNTGSPRKKVNLSYEVQALKPNQPAREADHVTRIITENKRWRRVVLLLVVGLMMLALGMLGFQVFGLFTGHRLREDNAFKVLQVRVGYMESKLFLRSRDIDLLKRTIAYQNSLILKLQNVLKLYNMTKNLTTMDAKMRAKRDTLRNIIDQAYAKYPQKDVEIKKLAKRTEAQLQKQIDSINLIPGPKGRTGSVGFHSFTGCWQYSTARQQIAYDGLLDSFYLNAGGFISQNMKIMSIVCSSKQAQVTAYKIISHGQDTSRDLHECVCTKPKKGGLVKCKISIWLCPIID